MWTYGARADIPNKISGFTKIERFLNTKILPRVKRFDPNRRDLC